MSTLLVRFLFLSLIAFGLKQGIRTAKDGEFRVEASDGTIAHVNLRVLRAGTLTSAAGSVSGCLFLTLALVDLVEIKLGELACLDWYGLAAVEPLVVLVPSALAFLCVLCYMRSLVSFDYCMM
nr:pecanex-like protein [Tanacetum cinerariifolium]